MDLAKEGTLKKFVQKNGKITEEFASKVVRQILEGLLYLHSQGILHKDLKTTNILMVGESIKVSDYALAELYDCRLLEGEGSTKKGKEDRFHRGYSLPYMAP